MLSFGRSRCHLGGRRCKGLTQGQDSSTATVLHAPPRARTRSGAPLQAAARGLTL